MVLAQDSNCMTFFKAFCVQKLPTERNKMSGRATATGKGRTVIPKASKTLAWGLTTRRQDEGEQDTAKDTMRSANEKKKKHLTAF